MLDADATDEVEDTRIVGTAVSLEAVLGERDNGVDTGAETDEGATVGTLRKEVRTAEATGCGVLPDCCREAAETAVAGAALTATVQRRERLASLARSVQRRVLEPTWWGGGNGGGDGGATEEEDAAREGGLTRGD